MAEMIPVRKDLDALVAQEAVKAFALDRQFTAQAAGDLAIIAGELATNLVKHTSAGGTIEYRYDEDEGSIELMAEDSDQGFRIDAIRDGFSTANSLGIGLGAVNRLSDELYFGRYEKFQVRAKKYREQLAFRLDAAALSYPTMNMVGTNGDAFVVIRRRGYALIAVIDALGHGVSAHESATLTREVVEREHGLPLNELIGRIHEILKDQGKKGIAASFLKVHHDGRAELSAVGNVYSKFYLPDQKNSLRLLEAEGIIGERIRRLSHQEFAIPSGTLAVMFTDGVSSQLDIPQYQRETPLVELSHQLMDTYSRKHDDRTIVLLKFILGGRGRGT